MPIDPLPVRTLYTVCDQSQFRFETTDDIEDLPGLMGQDRALDAIKFGTSIGQRGFNLFVLGPTGAGKHTAVRTFLDEIARGQPAPSDWAYVNNFGVAHQPLALQLPAGDGSRLKQTLDRLIDNLKSAIPAIFESEEYQTRRRAIDEEYGERQQAAFEDLQHYGEAHGVALLRTPSGFSLAPVRDGEVLKPDEFQQLPDDEKERIEQTVQSMQKELAEILEQIPKWSTEHRDRVRDLRQELAAIVIDRTVREARAAFADVPNVLDHLDVVRQDLIDQVDLFTITEEQMASMMGTPVMPIGGKGPQQWLEGTLFRRYDVNVIVDNGDNNSGEAAQTGLGAPVIYDDFPSLGNLVGKLEHISQMGALVTDFMLLKPGSLHKANGGYLLLDARKVLNQPFAWESLKRALRSSQITIESPSDYFSVASTVSLEPEPIPLDVKVVLVGDRWLYHMLCAAEPEFQELFKVAADFDDVIDREPENDQLYARLIANIVQRDKLKPLDRTGVARLIEHSSRLAEDAEKLSIVVGPIADIVREADYWAQEARAETISTAHIEQAIDAKIHRSDRIRERTNESITRDIMLIDTEGEKVGQINGLSVLSLGDFAFGKPSRITARVRIGSGRVVDIEREVKLGGPLHSKGVMILSGYLNATYLSDQPLSLAATLAFEQSYGGVDGDSASSTELYALLSALAEVPINQSLAVTGSVNQLGEVQAIGGVNEKIEGFFDICAQRGLTGNQGVLIPAANQVHLMLRKDVVDAAERGMFSIYAVEHINQGIELLMGMPAGERQRDGTFPKRSVNGMVEETLKKFAEARRKFGEGDANGPAGEDKP